MLREINLHANTYISMVVVFLDLITLKIYVYVLSKNILLCFMNNYHLFILIYMKYVICSRSPISEHGLHIHPTCITSSIEEQLKTERTSVQFNTGRMEPEDRKLANQQQISKYFSQEPSQT